MAKSKPAWYNTFTAIFPGCLVSAVVCTFLGTYAGAKRGGPEWGGILLGGFIGAVAGFFGGFGYGIKAGWNGGWNGDNGVLQLWKTVKGFAAAKPEGQNPPGQPTAPSSAAQASSQGNTAQIVQTVAPDMKHSAAANQPQQQAQQSPRGLTKPSQAIPVAGTPSGSTNKETASGNNESRPSASPGPPHP